LFPELRPYLEDAFDPEAIYVVSRTETDFERAVGTTTSALQKAMQQPTAGGCNGGNRVAASTGIAVSPGGFGGNELARKDSNLK
jgi:hypothetical protein